MTEIEVFENSQCNTKDKLRNFAKYVPRQSIARFLCQIEIFKRQLEIKGSIVECGVHHGGGLMAWAKLSSTFEPYNYHRKIIGFDTFEGYKSITDQDVDSETIKTGGYTVSENYQNYLFDLIDFHEQENVLYNGRKHNLIKGDAGKTIGKFFKDEPHTVVALAYFDMAVYAPTKKCLEELRPHLIKGSVVALDELNSPEYPGETIALKEAWGLSGYTIKKSKFMPGRAYIIID